MILVKLCTALLLFFCRPSYSEDTVNSPNNPEKDAQKTERDQTAKPEDSTAEKPAEPTGWWDGKWATGDWGGNRSKLEDKGIVFSLVYIGEVRSNFRGGISTRDATKYLGNDNASLDFFTDKFGLYDGGEFFIRFENVHGEGISAENVGDVQLLSSIDAVPFSQVSECFYQHNLLNNHLHLKIGKQDGTGDFIALKYGVDFTHSAYGCIANIPLPRFHDYALGMVVNYEANDWFSFGAGVYDGNSTGLTTGFDTAFEKSFHDFSIVEMRFKPTAILPNLPATYRIGAWHLSRDIAALDAVKPLGPPPTPPPPYAFKQTYGAYMDFDQMVYKTNDKPDDDQGLAVMGQYSWSPDDRDETPRFMGGGVRYKGTFSGRDNDVVGAGVSSVVFAEKLRRTQGKTQESAIEVFYKVQASKFMFFQPDFQYILKPGGNHRDAVTGGMRFQISF